jgi:hypothetical protein
MEHTFWAKPLRGLVFSAPSSAMRSWTPSVARQKTVYKVKFSYRDCGACPVRTQCTQSGRRSLTLRSRAEFAALQDARRREQAGGYAHLYAQRAGIEGVHAQGVRRAGLRRSRYIGEPRTHLQHVATAAALNLLCIYAGSGRSDCHDSSPPVCCDHETSSVMERFRIRHQYQSEEEPVSREFFMALHKPKRASRGLQLSRLVPSLPTISNSR